MEQKKYFIEGMHCASCELLIEKEINKIEEISECKVNHKRGQLLIKSERAVDFKQLKKAVKKAGFQLATNGKSPQKQKSRNSFGDYLIILSIFVVVLMMGLMMKEIGIEQYFPDTSADTGVLMAFVLGIVASVSTCLVLIGGIVLSFGSMVATGGSQSFLQRAHPHIYFHLGRLIAFFFLGGLLGLIGGKINYSIGFTGFLTFLVALVMLYIGLQTLNIVPSITRLGFHLPKGLSRHVHSLENCEHKGAPILVGALTFLLPCGFTQSVQLAAIASGSFWGGAMLMLAFALGTLPALFSLGLGSSFIQNRDFGMLKKIIGVIVVIFGLYSLQSALTLSGFSLENTFKSAFESPQNKPNNATAAIPSGAEQVVRMNVNWVYDPSEFEIKKGIPVRWEIDGINVSGCTNEVVIPKLGFSKKIEQGKNIAYFTPTETGILPFSCWMGMAGGRFIVTE